MDPYNLNWIPLCKETYMSRALSRIRPLKKDKATQNRSLTATETVYRALRERILTEDISSEEPLRQDELAEQFGTSRIPVREALKRLEADNLVTYTAHRGAVVTPFSLNDALEVLDIRIALEGRALELAVPNLSIRELSEIEASFPRYATAKN